MKPDREARLQLLVGEARQEEGGSWQGDIEGKKERKGRNGVEGGRGEGGEVETDVWL